MACIVVIHGEGLGKRVHIQDARIVVGRDHSCEMHILHPSISRQHCEIWAEAGRYRVRDMGSTNATRLNGRIVEVADLADGDHLTIGESILKFIGDASVEARYHEEVYQLASHDELTGFYNRRQFVELFERELLRTDRDNLSLGFAILDIDLFKRVNDSYGHLAGDQVIREIAQTIRYQMRAQDIAGRIGGEEFALLLPEMPREEATSHLEAMRKAVGDATHTRASIREAITISIGLALRDTSHNDRPSLMRAADIALYRAKQQGRNRLILAN